MQWNWQTVVIGFSFLAFLLLAKYIVSILFSPYKLLQICLLFLEIYYLIVMFNVHREKRIRSISGCQLLLL